MKYLVFFALSLLLCLCIPSFARAQSPDTLSSGIAVYVQIQDKNVHSGDIIRLTKQGYELSRRPYEPNVFGVVTENPSISLETTNLPNTVPVTSSGKVYVRVSSKNGNIKKGDFITSSDTPGVGQKATKDGYTFGTALQDYTASDTNKIGKILVLLNITYTAGSSGVTTNLLSTFQDALSAPYLSPLNALRYVLAALLIISSFAIAAFFFGRVSTVGVEAIGRNPLAGKMILLGVIFHLFLAALIVAIGIGVAYFVLVI